MEMKLSIFIQSNQDYLPNMEKTVGALSKGEGYENGGDERLPNGEIPVKIDDADATSSSSVMLLLKTDPNIWMPPEPTNFEDGMDSVANNDDDDGERNQSDQGFNFQEKCCSLAHANKIQKSQASTSQRSPWAA